MKDKEKQLDDYLSANITANVKNQIEEILFEIGVACEQKAQIIYQQGIKDCAWILKMMEVFA